MPPNPYMESSVSRSLVIIEQLDSRLDNNLEIWNSYAQIRKNHAES